MEIMKGDKLGRQGGSSSQEQPSGSQEQQRQPRAAQNGDHEGRQAWETRRQRQLRAAHNGDHEGKQMKGQGGSGITTIWRFWGSATQSLRSKNPYSFQLSGERKYET